MDFEIPKQGWFIFTKENCNYCKKAKALLPTAPTVSCDTFLITNRDSFLSKMDTLTGVEFRTFPMVFHDSAFIGGYTETAKYVEELAAFTPVDF